jgi:hypothetical protein
MDATFSRAPLIDSVEVAGGDEPIAPASLRARLEGSILNPGGVPLSMVSAEVEPLDPDSEGGDEESWDWHDPPRGIVRADIDESGALVWAELEPGPATVRISIHGRASPLLTIEGIELRAGETLMDPRLQGMDILAMYRVHACTVEDVSGAPISDAVAFLVDDEDRLVVHAFEADEQGRIRIPSPGDSVHVVVAASGYRVAELPELSGEQALTLLDAVRVTVVITEGWQELNEAWPGLETPPTFSATLGLREGRPVRQVEDYRRDLFDTRQFEFSDARGGDRQELIDLYTGETSAQIDASGRAVLVISEAGEYRCSFHARIPSPSSQVDSSESPTEPGDAMLIYFAGEVSVTVDLLGGDDYFEIPLERSYVQELRTMFSRLLDR